MTEFLGITIISLSILGLAYSIGNIVMALTKPLPVMHSVDGMMVFHKSWIDKQQNYTEVGN